jgi:hypothetical protein
VAGFIDSNLLETLLELDQCVVGWIILRPATPATSVSEGAGRAVAMGAVYLH